MIIPESQLPAANLQELGDLCASTPYGLILEIGVYKGGSAFVLQQAAFNRPLHLYDTFTGIPEAEAGDRFGIGAFNDVDLAVVRTALPNAIFHVGVFPDTLTEAIDRIAFVHIDCDQYQTCKTAIELLWPRMIADGIIAFDDYGFEGIQRAIRETKLPIEFTRNKIAFARKPI